MRIGSNGLRVRSSHDDERRDQHERRPTMNSQRPVGSRSSALAPARAPRLGVLLRGLRDAGEAVDERGQPERDQHGAGDVVAGVARSLALRHDRDGEHDGDERHGQVHPEAPAPVGVLGEHPAEQQPDGRAAAGDRAVDGEGLGPLLGVGEQHGDQREGRRCQERAEGALQGAGAEQHRLVLRQTAERRGEREAARADQVGALAAPEVGDAAAEQQEAAERERVGGDDPLLGRRGDAQVGRDRRAARCSRSSRRG